MSGREIYEVKVNGLVGIENDKHTKDSVFAYTGDVITVYDTNKNHWEDSFRIDVITGLLVSVGTKFITVQTNSGENIMIPMHFKVKQGRLGSFVPTEKQHIKRTFELVENNTVELRKALELVRVHSNYIWRHAELSEDGYRTIKTLVKLEERNITDHE